MYSRTHCVSTFSLATLAVFISTSVQAQDSAPQRRPVLVPFVPFSQAAANDTVRGLYVAVMGEVAHPGTYHLDPSELNLPSVVKRAGGLTSDATKSVRVIRQGRLNQQISYSEDSEKSSFLLSPGDLVIMDSKQMPDAVGKVTEFEQDPTTIRAGYEVAAPPAGVQVALLNVLDYPLIVTLPQEEATVGNLIERLGQPAEIRANYRVIATSNRSRNPEALNPLITLTSGSAVVFDRGAVNKNRLPANLPKPIESEIAAAAQSGLIGSPRGQSAELRNVGQQMFISSTNSSADSQYLHPNVSESKPTQRSPFEESSDDRKFDLPVPTLNTNPKVATVPFTGEAPITKSSIGTSVPSIPVIDPIPQPDDATVESKNVSATIDPSFSLDDPVETPASNSSIPLAVVTLAISGALIGGAVLFRKRWERQPASWHFEPALPVMTSVAETPEPARVRPLVVKTLLQQMINNELPVTIEAVEFPNAIALQGRIATKPILRVDGPQDLVEQQGPHFTLSDHDAEEPSLQNVIAQMDVAESMPRRPHFMTKEKQHIAAPAGSTRDPRNTLPSRGGASSNAPLASALFDLERGDHS